MGSQEKKGDKWTENQTRNWTLSSTVHLSRFVSVTLLLLYPRGPLGHLIFSRASGYYANKTSSFLNSAATVKRTFFLFSSY